jgi:hypothetical protein
MWLPPRSRLVQALSDGTEYPRWCRPPVADEVVHFALMVVATKGLPEIVQTMGISQQGIRAGAVVMQPAEGQRHG